MSTLYSPSEEITEFVLIGKKINDVKRIALHPVVNQKISAEIPFTKDSAKKIFSLFSDYKYENKVFEGLIPKEIIFAKDDYEKGLKIIWIANKSTRKIFFSETTKNDGLISEDYNVPTLIFKYSNKKLSVFAICDSSSKNINQDTELYHAPFYNVDSDGAICMGNVNINMVQKFKTFEKCKEFLEKSFFNSFFTHSNFKQKITPEYLLKMKNEKFFNANNLIKSNKNLNSIL